MKKLVEHLAIGQFCQAVMGRQIFDLLVRFGFFIDTVKISERKRNTRRQSLQKFDELRREGVPLAGMNEKVTHRPTAIKEGHHRRRFDAPPAGIVMPVAGVLLVLIIVSDAWLAWAVGD